MLPGPQTDQQRPICVDLRDQDRGLVAGRALPARCRRATGNSVRVLGRTAFHQAEFIEVVAPGRRAEGGALANYLWRLILVVALVSAMAGSAIYLTLEFFLVRPMQRITAPMERFRADPEDPAALVEPSGRRDEIGRAEAELDRMQADLRAALQLRARLAALGEAVAKINHDLRNMLTSAQIASDRLAALGRPEGEPGPARAWSARWTAP